MKAGDYVRTIYGIKKITDIICGQDIRFDNTDGFDEDLLKYHDYDGISKNSHTWEEIVIGEPKEKIIELIEVGDYVNGYYVTTVNQDAGSIYISEIDGLGLKKKLYEKDIKSIVTKESMESVTYYVK